jgi:catechol 2,3-dioxygenase-like lactoylglutathione lyase family enzyme
MQRAVPVLPVDDLTAARTFYVDGLGFEVSFEVSEDGKSGLLGARRGAIAITLDSPMDGHGRDACVSLEVESADRYYEEWRTRVPVKRPPRNEEWGSRSRRHGPLREHHLRRRAARVNRPSYVLGAAGLAA